MYFVGCTSIYLMAVISIDKLFIVYKPFMARHMSVGARLRIVFGCACAGLFWSSLPLAGWSYYSLEPSKTMCSVEWSTRSPSVTSYNVAMLLFVYIVPLCVIIVFNTKMAIFLAGFYRRKNEFMLVNLNSVSQADNSVASSTTTSADYAHQTRARTRPLSTRLTFIMIIYICKYIYLDQQQQQQHKAKLLSNSTLVCLL